MTEQAGIGWKQAFRDLDDMFRVVETWLIMLLVSALLGLGVYRGVSSWGGDAVWPALDSLLAAVLLWLLMLGMTRAAASVRPDWPASIATLLPPGWWTALRILTCLLAGGVSCFLMWAAMKYWALDFQLGSSWAPGLSSSVVLIVVPLGFALMAGRFFARAIDQLDAARRNPAASCGG